MNCKIVFSIPLLLVLLCSVASAAEPTYTAVNVKKMCCQGCVQKIAAKVYVVRGVAEVRVDLKKKIVYVVPQRGKVLSPRELWVAIEQADDQPLRLAGPRGVFTKKPPF